MFGRAAAYARAFITAAFAARRRNPSGRRRAGAREVEALAVFRAQLAEARELLLRLDALGDDFHTERLRHAQHGAHDRAVALVLPQPAHERAVDLDDVEREALEISERRVAGPEVVQRQAHADVLELAQRRADDLALLHEDRLGQLHDQPVRRNSR